MYESECGMRFLISGQLLGFSRKTECGAKPFWEHATVRATPFALMRAPRARHAEVRYCRAIVTFGVER